MNHATAGGAGDLIGPIHQKSSVHYAVAVHCRHDVDDTDNILA